VETLKEMKSIPINIVADLLGKSQQYVRIGLQQQRIPIGSAVQMSSEWTYHVSYELLKNYIGIASIEKYERERRLMNEMKGN